MELFTESDLKRLLRAYTSNAQEIQYDNGQKVVFKKPTEIWEAIERVRGYLNRKPKDTFAVAHVSKGDYS